MQYEIHGKPIWNDGKCGIYEAVLGGFSRRYVTIDPTLLVSAINDMPKSKAIEAVTTLRNQVTEQAKWQDTPNQNICYPIIQQSPEPTPINGVRVFIANTESFCNGVLKALKGE